MNKWLWAKRLLPALLHKGTSPATSVCCGPTHLTLTVQVSEAEPLERRAEHFYSHPRRQQHSVVSAISCALL